MQKLFLKDLTFDSTFLRILSIFWYTFQIQNEKNLFRWLLLESQMLIFTLFGSKWWKKNMSCEHNEWLEMPQLLEYKLEKKE